MGTYVDKTDIATQHAAVEIVKLNQEITLMLQQWLSASQLKPDAPASFVPDDVVQLMKQVDALLLVIGHTPKYTQIIAEHGMEKAVDDHHYP